MPGLNKAMLIGNLGRDPEMRYTQDGTAVASFSIATSREWKDKNSGEKRQQTEWHRVVAFAGLAEVCGKYLNKGSQVYIEGRLQTREWQDKEGNRRFTTEVVAMDMVMLGSRGGGSAYTEAPPPDSVPPDIQSGSSTSYQDERSAGSGSDSGSGGQDVDDDDIPF